MTQVAKWDSDFGAAYLERNDMSEEELDRLYIDRYGVSRDDMNYDFIGWVPTPTSRVLEVGCGHGLQLRHLGRSGFGHLYGIDVCRLAVQRSRTIIPQACIAYGCANNIPYDDDFFDMVFTSGLLIHISPHDLLAVMGEMVRCSKRFIWGFEYFSTTEEEIEYRGETDLLWKRDHAWLFQEHFGFQLIKETFFRHGSQPLYETMYLLEKLC